MIVGPVCLRPWVEYYLDRCGAGHDYCNKDGSLVASVAPT
jgi:hypothetical protein